MGAAMRMGGNRRPHRSIGPNGNLWNFRNLWKSVGGLFQQTFNVSIDRIGFEATFSGEENRQSGAWGRNEKHQSGMYFRSQSIIRLERCIEIRTLTAQRVSNCLKDSVSRNKLFYSPIVLVWTNMRLASANCRKGLIGRDTWNC